jgi:uracil-DNA glycosylase
LVATTVKAEELRIPRRVREAVAQHEEVLVVNRERPAFAIVHPDDRLSAQPLRQPRRSLRDALSMLAQAAFPDPEFGADMEAVRKAVGPVPGDPWERS